MMLLVLFLLSMWLPFALQWWLVGEIRESDSYLRVLWGVMLLGLAAWIHSLWVLILLVCIFVVVAMLDIGYARLFANQLSVASIEALMLTNRSEAMEFIQAYRLRSVWILLLAYGLLSCTVIVFILPPLWLASLQWSWLVPTTWVIIGLMAWRLWKKRRAVTVLPGGLGVLVDFWHQQKLSRVRRAQRQSLPAMTLMTPAQPVADTLVLVIGESSSATHYQLYGYPRETNPHLSQVTQLQRVDGVSSRYAQTIPALTDMLMLVNRDSSTAIELVPSLLDIAHAAGYHSVWLSNQELGDSLPLTVAQSAHRYVYCSGVAGELPDERVLPYLEEALTDTHHARRLIIIHLMGSHIKYELRYPQSFDYFSDQPVKAYRQSLSARERYLINTYDNSIRYTDYILHCIIERMMHHAPYSAMVYVSDHGEEVFDSKDFCGHEPDQPTTAMLSVPFLMVASDALRLSLKRIDHPRWLGDVLVPTLLRLMGVDDARWYRDQYDVLEQADRVQ